MAITKITEGGNDWYGVSCDHCKDDYWDEEQDIKWMPCEDSILNESCGNEWHYGYDGKDKNGKHYCDKCVGVTDEDIEFLMPERKDLNRI